MFLHLHFLILIRWPVPDPLKRSYRHSKQSLGKHGLGNLDKAAYIGAIDIVDVAIFPYSVFHTGCMDILHNAMKRLSTSSLDHDRRIEFWVISSPEVATPPAFAAFPGPNRILCLRKTLTASGVEGMLAPSETTKHPFLTSSAASAPEISFWVAEGNATWQGTSHGV